MIRICVVEDEVKVAALLEKGLGEYGYTVEVYGTGRLAEKAIAQNNFNLLILDVMLPDTNGFQLCRTIRMKDPKTPILMLTALNQVDKKVSGLKAGADDYLAKPFHLRELAARVEALLRRADRDIGQPEEWLHFKDVSINLRTKTAERSGIQINLTVKEYQLLELFLRNPERVLSRQQIAQQVWNIGFDRGTNFIDVYVNYLRNKIEKGFADKLIFTITGMGYILRDSEPHEN